MTKDDSTKKDYSSMIKDPKTWESIYQMMDSKGYLTEDEAIKDILFNCNYMLQSIDSKEGLDKTKLFNQTPDSSFNEETALEFIINKGYARNDSEAIYFAIRCYNLYLTSNGKDAPLMSNDRRRELMKRIGSDAMERYVSRVVNGDINVTKDGTVIKTDDLIHSISLGDLVLNFQEQKRILEEEKEKDQA